MSQRYLGGFITTSPVQPTQLSASGSWTLQQQLQAQFGSNWPIYYPPDPYYDYVSLLLNGDGTNGAQNNTFLDSSTNNFTITRNGNTTQGSFSPYGSNWSNYFSSNSYLSFPNISAYSPGTGAFTLECWVYHNAAVGAEEIYATHYSNGLQLSRDSAGKLRLAQSGIGTSLTGSTTLASNTWYHVAATRSGTTAYLFVNGVLDATGTVSTNYTSTGAFIVSNAGTNFYLSNLRLVNGTALYTSGFTPSTTPLTAVSGTALLVCQSNRFVDNSSNNAIATITGTPSVQRFSPFNPTAPYSTSVIGGSGYFDGSGDYLAMPSNSAFALNGGDFTIECWVYLNAYTTTNQARIFYPVSNLQNFDLGGTTGGSGPGNLGFYDGDGVGSAGGVVKLNTWTHVACVRSGTTVSLYANGSRVASATISVKSPSATSAYIASNGTTDFINGYIADYRIVKGTAVYSGTTYTVPTAPLTAITNTVLLLRTVNAGIPDLAMQNDLETVGNAQVSTSVKKYGTGSLAFDGTGDWMLFPASPNLQFGNGNFTIEGWIYSTTTGSVKHIFGQDTGAGTVANQSIVMFKDASERLVSYAAVSSTEYRCTSTATITQNQWVHIAFVRDGSTLRQYIDGVQSGTSTISTNSINSLTAPFALGQVGALTSNAYTGYIDDFRITKGLCRYPSGTTFTPPTSALPTY